MKKFLALFLAIVAIVSVFSVVALNASANDVDPDCYISGDYTYSVLDSTDAKIVGYSGADENLEIPKKLDKYIISHIGDYVFMMCESLTSVTIGEEVVSIGEGAFIGCSKLASITILSTECELFDNEYTLPQQVVIYAYNGSDAQAYAEKYNREFVSLGDSPNINVPTQEPSTETQAPTEETTEPPTEETTQAPTQPLVVLGDVDKDFEVSVLDASLIQLYLVDKAEFDEYAMIAADVDKDSEISVLDASLIQLFLVGKAEL